MWCNFKLAVNRDRRMNVWHAIRWLKGPLERVIPHLILRKKDHSPSGPQPPLGLSTPTHCSLHSKTTVILPEDGVAENLRVIMPVEVSGNPC